MIFNSDGTLKYYPAAYSIHEHIPKSFFTCEGAEEFKQRVIKIFEQIQKENPNVLVFLDKGGRPIHHALRILWAKVIGNKTPFPKVKFNNFGTESRWSDADDYYSGNTRNISFVEILKNDLSKIPNPRIMFVDDIFASGGSLAKAQSFYKSITSEANFSSATLFSGKDVSLGERLLPWHSLDSEHGGIFYDAKDITGVQTPFDNDRNNIRLLSEPLGTRKVHSGLLRRRKKNLSPAQVRIAAERLRKEIETIFQ